MGLLWLICGILKETWWLVLGYLAFQVVLKVCSSISWQLAAVYSITWSIPKLLVLLWLPYFEDSGDGVVPGPMADLQRTPQADT